MSRSKVDEFQTVPSAILFGGAMPVLLFAVSRITLSEKYSLPRIGSSSHRAAIANSDDTVSLSALLVGPQRYLWKQDLELMAESSRRGGGLAKWTGGRFGGVILVTGMTVRMDMQVTDLTFTASSQRRGALEVSISLKHVPRPGPLNLLLDVGAAAALTVVEFAL